MIEKYLPDLNSVSTEEACLVIAALSLILSILSWWRVKVISRKFSNNVKTLHTQSIADKWQHANELILSDPEFASLTQEMFGASDHAETQSIAAHLVFLNILYAAYDARKKRLINEEALDQNMSYFFDNYKLPIDFTERALQYGNFTDDFRQKCRLKMKLRARL